MPKRIDRLTEAQKARVDGWADKWIEIGLRTGAADRPAFEAAARECYRYAGIPWHGNVVWVPSPLVVALAAPIAALLIQFHRRKTFDRDAVRGAVRGAVDDAVGDAVDGAVRGAVRDAVEGAVKEVIKQRWNYYFGGQLWPGGYWWGGAFTSFFREVCGLTLEGDLWDRGRAYEQTIENACWWYPHRDFLMVCERPTTINRELVNPERPRGIGSHRLHRTDGPAVAWPDGWGVYAIHGVQLPGWIIEHPERITVNYIEREGNAEIRRTMIERYGWARYIADSKCQVVDECASDHAIRGLRGAKLLRKELAGEPEPIIYLSMVNSSPEPDGHYKTYLERIDPKAYGGAAARNCHAAMASRWRYRDDNGELQLSFPRYQDYRPSAES